jgi:MerR family transcriptional regulator, mercuric resistance operon regulatory protein
MQARPAPAASAATLSISQLAARTGTSPDSIRYYERLGLLPRAVRSGGQQRRFGAAHEQRLRFVRRARELGFGLEAIGSLLQLAAPGHRACATVRTLALAHLDDVRARLAQLQRLEAALADTVARCTGDAAPACAVLALLEAPADGGG